jgi:hypothetical protein
MRSVVALLGSTLLGCTPREAPAPSTGRGELVVPPMTSASSSVVARDAGDDGVQLLGRWGGVGKQSDGQTWVMSVRVTSVGTGRCAIVEYPDLGCEGEWVCLGPAEGGVLRAREDLTVGTDVCIDHGVVTMALSRGGDSLEWRWESASSGAAAGLTARARLVRP